MVYGIWYEMGFCLLSPNSFAIRCLVDGQNLPQSVRSVSYQGTGHAPDDLSVVVASQFLKAKSLPFQMEVLTWHSAADAAEFSQAVQITSESRFRNPRE